MAFHGLLVVRDEADILAQTLSHLLTWADGVYILDTGSTDGTWEIVQEYARRDRRIVPMMTSPLYWHLGLRAMLFDRYRNGFRDGDWIVRLDADEFYHRPPSEFVRNELSRSEGRIRSIMFEFVLTRSMVGAWERGEETTADRVKPIESRRRVYYIDPHPEVRLFKYRRSMRWPADRAAPFDDGLMAYERIPIRHYRCRDPLQVQERCALRSRMRRGRQHDALGLPEDSHWEVDDWNYWVWDDANPRLKHWTPGTELPTFKSPRAARGTPPHVAQQLFYGSGLPRIIDRFRPRFDKAYTPEPIPAELQALLATPGRSSPVSSRA